ncbi:unnamed protein product [Rhizoctonia solani]|uniref:Uncharacterized protein n=1 Tax=Rhizoctonia solani TaxID=456999 RepID=A0A8H3GV81_9AGAM|nr:unnamed protein product [Rhizoctonia solani]
MPPWCSSNNARNVMDPHPTIWTQSSWFVGVIHVASGFLAPPRGMERLEWYLRRERKEIKTIFHELREADDDDVWQAWMTQRIQLIRTREVQARPLIKWIESKERERKEAMNELKLARSVEAQARLLRLGSGLGLVRKRRRSEETPSAARRGTLSFMAK